MANEFTLADYEKTAKDNLNAAVAKTWREASPILDMLTFKPSTNLSEKILRFNALPTVPWRKIGESFTQLKVNPEQIEERLYFMGAKMDIPYEYVKAVGLVDQRAAQEDAILRGVAYAFNTAFFTGSPASDEDAIVGLHYRIVNDLAAAQSIDGAALDISSNTAVTVAAQTSGLFDLLDAALNVVEGNPSDKVLFMGETAHRAFQRICRASQMLATTKDQIGRQFLTYGEGGPKVVRAGYTVGQTAQILTDVELDDGSALTGGAASSIYCVRFGEPYLSGWCQEMPTAEDVGLLEDRVSYRTVVKFSPGLFMSHPRSMSRIYGLVAA